MVVLQEGIILFLSVYAGNWQQWDARSPVLSPALWDGQNVTLAVVAAKETSFLTLAWQDHGDLWPLLQIFWLPLLESIWFCYSFHLTFLLPKIPSEDFAPYIKHWQIFKQTNSVMCVCVSAATVGFEMSFKACVSENLVLRVARLGSYETVKKWSPLRGSLGH